MVLSCDPTLYNMFIAVRLSMWRLLTNRTDMDMDGMITVFTGEYSKNFGSVLIHTRFIILTSTVWTTGLFFSIYRNRECSW